MSILSDEDLAYLREANHICNGATNVYFDRLQVAQAMGKDRILSGTENRLIEHGCIELRDTGHARLTEKGVEKATSK